MIVEIEIPDEDCHRLSIYAAEELIETLIDLFNIHVELIGKNDKPNPPSQEPDSPK